MRSTRPLATSALVLGTMLLGVAQLVGCGGAPAPVAPAVTAAPATTASSGAAVATAVAASPTPSPAVTDYGFTLTPPTGTAVTPIGLLTDQADAASGALDGTAGNLTFVLVWNSGFHDANAALQAGFTALGERGATVSTASATPMTEGHLDAVGSPFQISTTTGTATGFAAAWGCGQPQRTFALVARDDPATAQQAVRTMLNRFDCHAR